MELSVPFTEGELVMLINLLMPIVIERQRKEPFADSTEMRLITKLIQMRKDLMNEIVSPRTEASVKGHRPFMNW